MIDWRLQAACRNADVYLFFPNENGKFRVTDEVREMCTKCPVSKECLADALTDRWIEGYRANTTPTQRRRMPLGITIKPHGTYAAYRAHQKIGTIPCQPCAEAGSKYLRGWNKSRSPVGWR